MADFNDFLAYAVEHISEIQYDSTQTQFFKENASYTLTQDDVALVAKISQSTFLALLREYHHWMEKTKNF